jgi:hypothetical protein
MNTTAHTSSDVSVSFVAQHLEAVTGVLHCWDRLRLMGSLRTLQRPSGMMILLFQARVLLKEFGAWAQALTDKVRAHGLLLARSAGQTKAEFLRASSERKEPLARARALQRGVQEGLIGVWSAVEPCLTYFLRKDAATGHLVLERDHGKCLHLYFYFLHRVCGLLHLRLQTWFPFTVSICLNGHEWLARQMDQAGLAYRRAENAFAWLQDVAAAQALADAQQTTDWPALLGELLALCHPLAGDLSAWAGQGYYWSVKESEFSTDVLFRSAADLAPLYPRLLRHGMEHFGSREVLRFLGKRLPAEGLPGNFRGELNSTLQERPEGVCLKHYAEGNSLKMYDKQGSILRVETTINQPGGFRVFRAGENGEPATWRAMPKGIAHLHRRAQVSRAANERYLAAQAAVTLARRTGEVADTIFRPVVREGRRYRSLQPWSEPDARLFALLNDGAWAIHGFRNRDLRERLFPGRHPEQKTKQLGGKITRLLRLLRAHHLVKKVPRTHRYHLTERGREIISALLTARATNLDELLKIAA